jgi:hypothetical protein
LEDGAQVGVDVLLRRELKLGNLVHREVSSARLAARLMMGSRSEELLFSFTLRESFRITQVQGHERDDGHEDIVIQPALGRRCGGGSRAPPTPKRRTISAVQTSVAIAVVLVPALMLVA